MWLFVNYFIRSSIAVPVGFQSVRRFLLALKTGAEPEPWSPGTLEPAVGLQSWVKESIRGRMRPRREAHTIQLVITNHPMCLQCEGSVWS
jgi:hypothetical protein